MTFGSHLAFGAHFPHLYVVTFVPEQGCDIFLRPTCSSWDDDLEQGEGGGHGWRHVETEEGCLTPYPMTDCGGSSCTSCLLFCRALPDFLSFWQLHATSGDKWQLSMEKRKTNFPIPMLGGDSLCHKGSIVHTQQVVEPAQLLKCSPTNSWFLSGRKEILSLCHYLCRALSHAWLRRDPQFHPPSALPRSTEHLAGQVLFSALWARQWGGVEGEERKSHRAYLIWILF